MANYCVTAYKPHYVTEYFDIFYRPEFYKLHESENSHYITIANGSDLLAAGHFVEKSPGIFKSPVNGSYGGIQLKPTKNSLENIEICFELVENYFIDKQCKEISISLPPLAYRPDISSWINLLYRKGFAVNQCELNYAINVNNTEYTEIVSYGGRKKLNRGSLHTISFRKLDETHFQEAYTLISENRIRKGRQLSMPYGALQSMLTAFPHNVHWFGVYTHDQLIAAAITLQINANILYVYAWGEAENVNEISPVTFLSNGLYEFCRQNKISLLDLGTSTVQSEPNIGLINFKKNLGAEESLKFILHKRY